MLDHDIMAARYVRILLRRQPLTASIRRDDDTHNQSDAGSRPYVKAYTNKPKYHSGDEVYIVAADSSLEGPYIVDEILGSDRCTLRNDDGSLARGGAEIEMAKLAPA
ncbi:hypothetical protein BDW74DRAFT_139652 [Aspergillus multicolor]|uniref:uncharacterized protein n=1 Tax=Aspergillus multicolor TaxID=41759 RepID=UPI003CCD40BC